MIALIAALLLAADTPEPGTQSMEDGGVRVTAAVVANDYRWSVTNVDAPPVTTFRMPHYNAFNHQVPEGWQFDYEGGEVFRAWTDDPRHALGPGETGRFSARGGVRGTQLGTAPLELEFRGRETLRFAAVWSPSVRSRSLVVLVAVALCGIVVCHALLVGRKDAEHAGGER